jgi:hypothetical protein
MRVGTLTLPSKYLFIINIPGVKPLASNAFSQQLFASITSFASCNFCACEVDPHLINLKSLMSFLMSTKSGITLDHKTCNLFNSHLTTRLATSSKLRETNDPNPLSVIGGSFLESFPPFKIPPCPQFSFHCIS